MSTLCLKRAFPVHCTSCASNVTLTATCYSMYQAHLPINDIAKRPSKRAVNAMATRLFEALRNSPRTHSAKRSWQRPAVMRLVYEGLMAG
jgi:hypothetical protein